MNCPMCQHEDSRVTDSRGDRRRRECLHCRHRWTTIELMASKADAAERITKAVLEAAGRLKQEA